MDAFASSSVDHALSSHLQHTSLLLLINPTPLCTPSLQQTHGALAHQPTMPKWALPKQQGLATSLDMSLVPAGSTVLLNHTMLIPTAWSQTSQQGMQSGRGCTSTPLHTLRVCYHCTTAQQQPPLLLRSAGLLGCLLVCQAATGSQQCCCPLAMPQATHIHGTWLHEPCTCTCP
jgi:hypothetical protein